MKQPRRIRQISSSALRLCGLSAWRIALTSALVVASLAKDGKAACVPGGGHVRVAAVNERLELTLTDGRVLRIAGLEAPGPTPADPNIAMPGRDWLTTWLEDQDILIELLDARPDRWGRYIGVAFARSAPSDVNLVSVGERLTQNGFARIVPDQRTFACAQQLLLAEQAARAAGRGLWGDPYYAVVQTTDTAGFTERGGSFILAEGRLTGVREVSARTMLFFGPQHRRNLAVTILQRNVKIFEAAGLHFHDLIGQTLRIRGLLETRFGPEIELTHPSEIERISDGAVEVAKPVK